MTDDTARRERALATVDEIPPDADMDWADAQETRSDYGLGFLVGYLAGAREEAAEKDKEIAALREKFEWAEGLRKAAFEKFDGYVQEIAALREERERMYTVEEVTAWLSEYHEKYREIPMTEWIRTRRALEGQP